MRVIGVVGYKNNGKTTLTVRLVERLSGQGLRVATVKHAHHEIEPDVPGKDSHRHRRAGAGQVLLATSRRWALFTELGGEPEPPLPEMLAKLEPCDLVLVEGFKREGHPKIEVHRSSRGTPLLTLEDPSVVALATDLAPDDARLAGVRVPVLHLDDVEALAALALERAVPVPELAGQRP